ncbi:MAG TPA: hypothetical protein GX707_19510 [Epulopiscium sp.]|nr:hypothetical protein [Candidatus Epulonipiscium sp.]
MSQTLFENRKFLQIGEDGIAHEVTADGAIKKLSASGDAIMNSQENIDYTITINGLDLGDEELNIKSRALAYIGIDVDTIKQAYEYSIKDNVIIGNYNLGDIATESGMGPALADKRNAILTQSVVTDKSKFDQVFDSGFKDYLNSGGQAIIDERTAAWEKNQK